MRMYISSILFLIVTLGSLAYVAVQLDQFNTQLSHEIVFSFTGEHR